MPSNVAQAGVTTTSAVTVTNSATQIAAKNTSRRSLLIYNNGSVTVYLGGSGVTSATGIPLAAASSFLDDASNSAWYGITAAGSADVRAVEVA